MSDASPVQNPDSRPIRVLVADDSLTVRKRLIAALASAPDVAIVGEASDGDMAVEACRRLRPDVLLLDIVMPRLDGVKTTEEIMSASPTPILVVSGRDRRGTALSTVSALAAGAVDAIEKPDLDESDAEFDARLLRAVRLVARVPVVTRRRWTKAAAPAPPALEAQGAVRRDVLAIGGSTGAPAAVVDLLTELPSSFSLPIVLVLHLGPAFGFAFADWLGAMCRFPVLEASDGQALLPGHVHVCPPERHLVLRGSRLHLTRDPERHSCRPSVDVFFESVAASGGERAIACLLTGIGRDGAEGLRRLRELGALTMAQDEASCAVFGMPREAVALGAALHVVPPNAMALLAASAARVGRERDGR